MDKYDFAKTYAFLFIIFFNDKKYSWFYRTIILVINGYPFINKREVTIKIINSIIEGVVHYNVKDNLIKFIGTNAEYQDILAAIRYINDDTNFKMSNHFVKQLKEYVDEVDDYIANQI